MKDKYFGAHDKEKVKISSDRSFALVFVASSRWSVYHGGSRSKNLLSL